MAYESTDVVVSKSQDQIRKLIYAHKGTGIVLISQPPHEGFEAFVEIEQTRYHIRIMAQCKDQKRDKNNYLRSATGFERAQEQELRRVWRVLFWHLKALFEAADAGVIDIRDVIMPYVVMRDGMTVADVLRPQMGRLMNTDSNLLLKAPVV